MTEIPCTCSYEDSEEMTAHSRMCYVSCVAKLKADGFWVTVDKLGTTDEKWTVGMGEVGKEHHAFKEEAASLWMADSFARQKLKMFTGPTGEPGPIGPVGTNAGPVTPPEPNMAPTLVRSADDYKDQPIHRIRFGDDHPTDELRPNYYKVRVRVSQLRTEHDQPTAVVECFDLIDALKLGFYSGNVLKYLFRLGRKTATKAKDLVKIRTYGAQAQERESDA